MELGREEMGIGQVKNATKLAVLMEVQPFFLNKHYPDCCKPSVHFRVMKKLTDHFCPFSIDFMEKIFPGL